MSREYPDHPRVGVGVVVFHEGRVLLVERGRPPSRGEWAVPGGRLELGETLAEAAEREVAEETGVRVRAGDPVYVFDAVVRDDAGAVRFHYVVVDVSAEYLSGTPRAGDDVVAARWVSEVELAELCVSAATRTLLVGRLGFGA